MKTKKINSILIACVNYNTYDKLNVYIDSIGAAKKQYFKDLKITMLIADNSDCPDEGLIDKKDNIEIIFINNHGNKGYLGGVKEAIEVSGISFDCFDYFIISNVDVTISKLFFPKLLETNIDTSIGCIAPAIISEKENRDRNPKICVRPTKKKMKLIALMYKYPIFHYLYTKTIYLRKKRIHRCFYSSIIYAGHGSFMIFTRNFLNDIILDFPCFLFGEEIFFAEILKKNKLKTIYEPRIIVYDFDHVSTSKMKKKKY